MNNLLNRLQFGASALALVAATAFISEAAFAQDAAPAGTGATETVVVTGTNIRGTTSIGSNPITVSPVEMKQTGAVDIQGVLANNPALMGMGGAGQGQSSGAVYEPSIHSLGNSGATSTLVLIDGHRMPTGGSGTNHTEPDPNLIPFNIIQRVDILAEGASSIYGSDAIAGVVNFITRSHFEGVQLSGATSFTEGKTDLQGGILAGSGWAGGNVIFAYTYVHEGQLKNTARPWTNPASRGLPAFNNFNCDPATLSPGGQSLIYTSATSGVGVTNTPANQPCNQWAYGALVPETVRNNMMIKVAQDFGKNFTLSSDLVYATRRDAAQTSRGTLTATAFGAGTQANPFFTLPAGYTGTSTTENIRWDADQLLGPGAYLHNGADTMYGDANLEYRLGDNFVFDLLALVGRDDSTSNSTGQVNPSAATLALNGTVNTGGVTTTPIPNTNIFYTQTLNPSNALDVWNPAATNRTSAAVIQTLLANNNLTRMVTGVEQLRLSANGSVYDLPAGPLKIAVGAETLRYQMWMNLQQPNGSGGSNAEASSQFWDFNRNDYAYFGEANIPVISPEMNIPLVQKFAIDISGRYDNYSDSGSTANPRFAFDWQVIGDLKLRGNYATSFVAPPQDEVGDINGNSIISSVVPFTNNIAVPVALFPQVAQFGIAGCTTSSVTCNINTLQGLHVTTGDHSMKPDKGRTWSLGADYTPSFLPGFTTSATLWYAHLKGAAQGPQIAFIINNSTLSKLVTFYPGGATQAQINALSGGILATSAIPNNVQYIVDTKNSSIVNLQEQGVDLTASYNFQTEDYGNFHVTDAASIIMNAHECLGFNAVCPGGAFSITDSVGTNGTFSTVAQQMRFDFGWALGNINADFFWNFVGAYHNWGAGAFNPPLTNSLGAVIGGGDHVSANSTFDLHVGYDFDVGFFGDDEISLTVRNFLNSRPPVFYSSSGYDSQAANPLGRVYTISLQALL